MTTNVLWKRWRMRNSGRVLLIALAGLACASPALADSEARNLDRRYSTALRTVPGLTRISAASIESPGSTAAGVHSPAVSRVLNSGYVALWHKADAFTARDCDKTRFQNRHWRPVPDQSLVREYAT